MPRQYALLQIDIRKQLPRPFVRPAHMSAPFTATYGSESSHSATAKPFFSSLLSGSCAEQRLGFEEAVQTKASIFTPDAGLLEAAEWRSRFVR